MPQHAVIQFI